MIITSKKIAKAINKLSETENIEEEKLSQAIFDFLKETNSIFLSKKILFHIENMLKNKSKKQEFKIETKNKLNSELLILLKKKLIVPDNINPEVINTEKVKGGIRAFYNNKQIDETFSKISQQLQAHLISN